MYNFEGAGVYYETTGKQGQSYSNYYPANPTRLGYRFAGWCFDEEGRNPVEGKITSEKVLYAKWEPAAENEYLLHFTLDNLGSDTGPRELTLSANGSSGSITVSITFENAKNNYQYNEFGFGPSSGATITVPNGYVISAYEFSAYGYDNLELYADSSRTNQYQIGNTETSGNVITYTGSGVSYPSLYAYNRYGNGNFWFYYMDFTIIPA